MKPIIVRSLSGIVYILLIFFCTTNFLSDFLYTYLDIKIKTGLVFYILNSVFLLACLIELIKLLKYTSFIYKILTVALTALVYYFFSQNYFNVSFNLSLLYWRYILMIVLFLLAIITIFKFSDELYTDSSKLIFTIAYLGIPFGLSLTLPTSYQSFTVEIFFIFVLIWISDSFAYFIGSKLGKRKLAPKISPNKSVEGLLGGAIFTIIAGIIIEYFYAELKGNWVIISIIISIFAPVGDLAESKLKRVFNIKDSGNLMPGHGGVLDRLDSFIFCVPMVFIYYLIISII